MPAGTNRGALKIGFSVGESTTVKGPNDSDSPYVAPDDDKVFFIWNTKADGSGKSYLPGTLIKLEDECTVLYAQWKAKTPVQTFEEGFKKDIGNAQKKAKTLWENIRNFLRSIRDHIAKVFHLKGVL